MAININPGAVQRHLATYNSSGNFTVAAGVNQIFVSMQSPPGGGGGSSRSNRYGDSMGKGGTGGRGAICGAFVQVSPGSTYAIVVGAAGAGGAVGPTENSSGTAGGTGGSSTFDGNTFVVTGGAGGAGGQNYVYSPPDGANGVGSGITSLTTLPPSNAASTRVSSIITSNTLNGTAGTGGGQNNARYNRYSGGGNAGSGVGAVHIYT